MDGEAALRERIARIEAALGATARALEAARARAGVETALAAAQAELDAAHARIAELEGAAGGHDGALAEQAARAEAAEAALAERDAAPAPDADAETARLRAAVDRLAATSAELRAGAPGATDRALEAEVEALRAARSMDLKEMEALLAELEPMLEPRPDVDQPSEARDA